MSATDEIRSLLNERGVEYTESQDRFRTRFRFNYCESCGDYLDEIEDMGACITASKSYLTPEQAIAATLGDDEVTAESVRIAIERLRQTVREAFVAEPVSILVEGYAIMRAIDDVEIATLRGDA